MLKTLRVISNLKRCSSQNAGQVSAANLKAYSPAIEEPLREKWRHEETFCSVGSGAPFSSILPPPNVTGTLHLGHALTVTVADVICRWQRMQGKRVAWIPGTDHAGIATQAVVERELMSRNISRHDLGKNKFVEEVWKWKNSKGSRISDQLSCLGASVDWTKEYFTLDQIRSQAVTEALIKLWDAGLVYRAESLVNWCCHLRSAISDIEVDHITVDGPTPLQIPGYDSPITFGVLDHFAFRLADSDAEVVVATTRLETMLGDVAVAVHPSDARYASLQGRNLVHPFNGSHIPIIPDDSVDPNFGTGAVKVTPAHDTTDFEIGKRHGLRSVSVVSEDGTMSDNCGQFKGLKRLHAREAVRTALTDAGLFRKTEGHKTTIPVCSRSGDVIEMILKPQWFINCKGMASKAIQAVEKGELVITPDKYNKMWFSWLENVKDWCISRQLWWGHQVPFYHCSNGLEEIWLAACNPEDARDKASTKLSGDIEIVQDSDVLDTWFSSGLLPFSCLGWPKQTDDLKEFYPLSTLVTGHDIMFFWVARMVMLGLELTGQLPFKHVLLHSIVYDSEGTKMSKSLGNVIDPLDVIKGCPLPDLNAKIKDSLAKGLISKKEAERALKMNAQLYPNGIPECGTDALRFSLLTHSVKNNNINFNVNECHTNKLFCNKIWQCHKFALLRARKLDVPQPSTECPSSEELIDVWILSRLSNMVDDVNRGLANSNFHESTRALRSYLYGDLCDVYIEAIKPVLNRSDSQAKASCCVLLYCLDASLRCLAPFMPFLSNTLYSTLVNRLYDSLELASFPSNLEHGNSDAEQDMDSALEIVRFIRNIKSEHGAAHSKAKVFISSQHEDQLRRCLSVINSLTGSECLISDCSQHSDSSTLLKGRVNASTSVSVLLESDNCVKSKPRLSPEELRKKKQKIESELGKLMKMMSHEGYQKVSEKSRLYHQNKIIKLRAQLERIESS